MRLRSIGNTLMLSGVLCFTGAVAWWLLFFEQMLGTAVKQASQCFYYTTIECEAASAIDLFFDIPAYSPLALWIAVGLLGTGTILLTTADSGLSAGSDQSG